MRNDCLIPYDWNDLASHAIICRIVLREIRYAEVRANHHDSGHGMDNDDDCCNDDCDDDGDDDDGRSSSCRLRTFPCCPLLLDQNEFDDDI